jgi:LPS O-antigen subunit length determinant protein (WzzB/FepE family)
MKKNNTYLADYEINLGDLIKSLWKEKILILSISMICGLAGYLYASLKPQEFKTEIKLKSPPPQLFEVYVHILNNNNNNNTTTNTIINNTTNNNTTTTNNNNNFVQQFISDFNLYFLSLDNLQSFIEESGEFGNFKEYLKLRNISAKNYFVNKIGEVKEKNLIISNKYFLVFTKELNGDIFFKNYVEFIKKKTVFEIKNNLKLSIENKITIHEHALEKAKLINLDNPIQRSINEYLVVNKPEDLFYKGTKILSSEIIYLKRLLIKLEKEQFDFEIILDKPLNSTVNAISNLAYFVKGLILGLLLSFGIIFFKNALKNN